MDELAQEAYGPLGDPSRHLTKRELDLGLRSLSAAPKNDGRLVLVVRRLGNGSREELAHVRLTPEEGVPGDGWKRRPPRNPETQLAVMRHDVARLIANGQLLTVFGDNLFVDLDISADNLPTGSLLSVGDAIVEVTPKPHDGCSKFKGRFGPDALAFVGAPPTRHQNLRGIYWKVVRAGNAALGAPIQVLSRPAVGSSPPT
jgi:hypothetical protein